VGKCEAGSFVPRGIHVANETFLRQQIVALHFPQPARSGTIAAFVVWSFVSVLIVPARKLGLGASYPRRFGRLFRELILRRLPMSAARLSRPCAVPSTRSAFADELSALSKCQKFCQSTLGKIDDEQ
jgi:hypothetical protein